MILALQILGLCWLSVVAYGLIYVFIPYFGDLIDQARWQRLHPNMPSWRRAPL